MPDARPCQITAHLAAPVAVNPVEGLSLDGPLAYAVAVERHGPAVFDAPASAEELTALCAQPDPAIPLAVWPAPVREGWCYCASQGELLGAHGTELVHWNKRVDDQIAQHWMERGALELGRTTKLPTNTGPYKSYHMPLYVVAATAVRWYALGDRDRIAALLTTWVQHLGKKRNSGHGAVLSWTVAPWDGDAQRWQWRDPAQTQPARPLPLALLPQWEGETQWRGYRAPYWLPAHQDWCAV